MSKQGRLRGRTSMTRHAVNRQKPTMDESLVLSIPIEDAQRAGRFCDAVEARLVQVQTRPVPESRVLMTNKACDATPEVKDAALRTSSTGGQYDNLLFEQYGFNPSNVDGFGALMAIDKVLVSPVPKVDYSSQCVNPTTTTGTNGTTIDQLYNFGTDEHENRNGFSPKDIEISETPRLKVISEKFTRFKKDHIELRRLEERIICVEYDVFNRCDMIRQPVQVMRAYFCIKTSCKRCQNSSIFRTVPSSIRNSPLMEVETDKNNDLEKEVEIIDAKIPENKPYLKDLRTLLKKRQAMCAKKKKSSLDLMSMYIMAKNEVPPRDHDWSNTNLLSKAELQEVKDLILKKCQSGVCNLSRKKMKVNETSNSMDSNYGTLGKYDSIYNDLFCDLDSFSR